MLQRWFVGRAAGEVRSFLFGSAEQSIARNLSREAFARTFRLPVKFYLGRSSGALAQTLENGLQGYRPILQHALFTLLPALVEILLIAAFVLYFFDPVFLTLFAACAAAYLFAFYDGARRVARASGLVSLARAQANSLLYDGLQHFETVKAFCAEDVVTRRYDDRNAQTQASWSRFYHARLSNGLMVALIFMAGLSATLWTAAAQVQAGRMTVGDLVLINAWMLQLIRPLELFGFGVRDIGQGMTFVEQLNGLLREAPVEQGEGAAPRTLPDRPPAIRFENFSFSYEGGRKVLDNVSFEIEAGKVTALVGPSGSGKSSVIRLLMKFHGPDEGRILIDGVDIADCSPADIRRLIALVPQDSGILNESLAFNISFLDEDAEPEDVDWAAGQALLADMISGLSDGYASQAGERGLRLSGGEKQRIAIARALMRRSPILLADEPTSAIDMKTEALIFENGVFSGDGTTCLVVAHRLVTTAQADQIILLKQRRVVERGAHGDLLAVGGHYAEFWN